MLVDYPSKFNSVYVDCMFASIVVPLILSSLHVAHNSSGLFGKMPKWRRIIHHILMVIFSPLMPLLLINYYESNKEHLRRLAKMGRVETLVQRQKLKKIKKLRVEFSRIELALESFYQVSGQLLLLLLATTNTPTVYGLMTSNCWTAGGITLYISVALGIKSCVWLHVRSLMTEKIFFPITSAFVIGFCALFSTLRRIISLISFFIPSLGLCGLLHHWHAEKIPFQIRQDHIHTITPEDKIALYNISEDVLWTSLDRWDYSDPSHPIPPDYSLYTGLSLGATFGAFFAILGLHFVVMYLVKLRTSGEFRRASLINQVVHIFENLNIPSPYSDWDELDENQDDDKEIEMKMSRKKQQITEQNKVLNKEDDILEKEKDENNEDCNTDNEIIEMARIDQATPEEDEDKENINIKESGGNNDPQKVMDIQIENERNDDEDDEEGERKHGEEESDQSIEDDFEDNVDMNFEDERENLQSKHHLLIEKFKQKRWRVEKEMIGTFGITTIFALLMFVPLFYTGIDECMLNIILRTLTPYCSGEHQVQASLPAEIDWENKT